MIGGEGRKEGMKEGRKEGIFLSISLYCFDLVEDGEVN